MDWKKLARIDRVLVVVAVLFVIDLLALPWVDVSVGPFSVTSVGTGSPDGFLGILALLVGLGIVASVLLERLTTVRVPALALSRRGGPLDASGTRLVAAIGAFVLVALKFVLHPHPSVLGAGCWLALVLAVALVVVARRSQGAGAAPAGGGEG